MHCIVLSSPGGNGAWRIHRSVEILAYHAAERRVVITLLVLAESHHENNILRILHPGNTRGDLMRAWPFPRHPDENPESPKSILSTLYGQAFDDDGGAVSLVAGLSARDSWYGVPRHFVNLCSPRDGLASERLEPVSGIRDIGRDDHVPFTVWQLQRFPRIGHYLIMLSLEFSGQSYDRLVGRRTPFSIDGPRRLLAKIDLEDIGGYPVPEQLAWREKLTEFRSEKCQLRSNCYDIILLHRPAEPVYIDPHGCASSVLFAPTQAPMAQRFLTTNHSFTLALRYGVCLDESATLAVSHGAL